MPKTKALVVAAIVGAVVFGLYLGYLALSNDSFPVQEKPFADYAKVVNSSFNGTELAFRLQWLDAGYLPMYVQLTSPATDAANTCSGIVDSKGCKSVDTAGISNRWSA